MKAGKMAAVVAVALLGLGLLSASALGSKKKSTTVVVNAGSVLTGKQNVKVSGSLNTATACRGSRDMRLLLTDPNGVVLSTLDSATSQAGGTWKLQANLGSPPTSSQFLQVKAKKVTAGKFVCKAGVSALLPIQ